MSDTPRGIFPKSAHLLKRADFRRVYESGKRHFSGNMTVFYLHRGTFAPENTKAAAIEPSAVEARIGFTVPRALGNAVERNRIRRRTREAVRQHYAMLAGQHVDAVINPRKSVLKANFGGLSREVARAFTIIRQSSSQEQHATSKTGRVKAGQGRAVGSPNGDEPRLVQRERGQG